MKTMTTMKTGPAAKARMLVLGVTVAVLGGFAQVSWAQPGGGYGGFGGHGGHGHGGMMQGSPERMGRMMDRMLDGLNATDAQRTQIRQIAAAAANDLKSQREAGRSLRERGMQLFTQPNVDANAAEALRQQMLAQHDQASRRMMVAMLDISRVLTPEQKAKLAERMKERAARMQERRERMQREQPAR